MLMGLICTCSNTETQVRDAMRRGGDKDYMHRPVFRGKSELGAFEQALPEQWRDSEQAQILLDYVKSKGSYAVVLGFDDTDWRWADIKLARPTDKLDAQAIASDFM